MLEPCDAKVSCTVLRGLGDRKVARLLGSLPLHLSEVATRTKPLARRTLRVPLVRGYAPNVTLPRTR